MTAYRPANIPEIARGTTIEVAAQHAAGSRHSHISGAHGGSLASFLVETARRRGSPVVAVVEDMARARALAQDLAYHARLGEPAGVIDPVLLLPQFDLGPYDELTPARGAVMQRAAVLFNLVLGAKWRFLVVPADGLLLRILPRRAFESACLPISLGERLNREELIECLERGGYHRSPLVEEPGTYAVRGSLIDVFPSYHAKPARIDMFGPDVEKIRIFDPESQSSEDEIGELWVHPVRLAMRPGSAEERHRAAERIRAVCDAVNQPTSQTEQRIEDVLSGRLVVGAQGFEPAFHPSLGGLVEYLPEQMTLCVEHAAGVRMAWQKTEASINSEYERRVAEGTPSFPPESFIITSAERESLFERQSTVFVHSLALTGTDGGLPASAEEIVDLNAVATADLGERLRHSEPAGQQTADLLALLPRYLSALEEEGYSTTVVAHTAGQAGRLASMLRGRGLKIARLERGEDTPSRPGISVAEGELARGYILPANARCLIAEEEVFGRRSRRRLGTRRGRRATLDDLRLLKPNDLVVHLEHGIGRYEGLARRRVRNSEMDFLLISYRDGDKLYLPVYRLNQVQKFRGGEGQTRLDKLGGQTFARSVKAVRRATREMAGQLLDLYARRAASTRDPIRSPDEMYRAFEAGFPFDETEDQERAIDEVMADLETERPMDRLVCGDVGFGKTEVAMRAAFRVVMEGRQTAILVPTTVLAQQHFQTFKERFDPYPVRVEMLSRFRTQSENKDVVLGLKEGKVDIVIGTHRLLSKDVHFKRLGLLVVDEEHRFGVAHKERIRALRAAVDTLVLTATPIPRTLQMAFGEVRDLSLIGTAPAARRPVKTMICHDDPKILSDAIKRELAREGQVFFVHNRVRDISRVAQRVQRMVGGARVAIGHGQMKEENLERVMLDFVAGRYDILVCTSIIESGLDIPRANTIIIDRADIFGMAQLYQLRGRVGRSNQQAYAYLVVPPLSILTEDARQRVETLARYTELGSGFSVATMDMEIRGAGNLLGPEQSGSVNSVGFEMFCELLGEATAELRGEKRAQEIEPELTFEQPGFIPEDYLPDVGQRLQYYKRLASAHEEEEVQSIAADLVDRFGPLPAETEELVQVMVVKALSRKLGIRGVEQTSRRLTIHLAPDSRVDPDIVIEIIRSERGRVQLSDDLKISVRSRAGEEGGVRDAIRFLHQLGGYGNNPPIS